MSIYHIGNHLNLLRQVSSILQLRFIKRLEFAMPLTTCDANFLVGDDFNFSPKRRQAEFWSASPIFYYSSPQKISEEPRLTLKSYDKK